MANRDFVAVTWSPNQLVDEDTLEQMNSNTVYLRDQSVDGLYQHPGGAGTSTGIKLLCGRVFIPSRKTDAAAVNVSFRSMFTPNSRPVITTAINSHRQLKIFHVIEGLGTNAPDHRGFRARVRVEYDSKRYDKIRSMTLNWIAMGY